MQQVIKISFFFLLTLASCSIFRMTNKCSSIGEYQLCDDKVKVKFNGKENIQAGTLKGKNFKARFTYSANSDAGPQNEREYFETTFRNIYYIKYFDSLFIDKKVHKKFRDETEILSLDKIKAGSERSCKTCNRQALLKIQSMTKPFYYFVSSELEKELSIPLISYDTIGLARIKYYESPTQKGAYITHLKDNRLLNKLHIFFEEGSIEEFKRFLRRIGL